MSLTNYTLQSLVTLIVTTILAAFACFGLLAVSGWFVCELLVFVHYEGRVWLLDAIKDIQSRAIAFAMECWLRIWTSGKDIIHYRPSAGKFRLWSSKFRKHRLTLHSREDRSRAN